MSIFDFDLFGLTNSFNPEVYAVIHDATDDNDASDDDWDADDD